MRTTTAKMDYDQLCLLPEDGRQHELFDGELVVTPSPSREHQEIILALARRLADHVEQHSLGKVYIAPLDTIFDEYTVLQPDILFISNERLPEIGRERIEGAPDIVIEVLSPTTFYKDLRRKMAVYSKFGVKEYWIVDREMKAIELHVQSNSELRLAQKFSFADTVFRSPSLPGFLLPLDRIF